MGGGSKSFEFKMVGEDNKDEGSGNDANNFTGFVAGTSKTLSKMPVNWYTVFIIVLIVICLPLLFYFSCVLTYSIT